MHLRPRHVRPRLTLWYVGVLSAVLALYIGSTLVFLSLSQRRELDQRLHAEFETVEDLLVAGPGGSVRGGGPWGGGTGGVRAGWGAGGGGGLRREGPAGEGDGRGGWGGRGRESVGAASL